MSCLKERTGSPIIYWASRRLSALLAGCAAPFDQVLVTKEWTPLEPGVAEHKYYAAGVGDIKEVSVKGQSETLELVGVNNTG
jgi:hypothetical protein